MESCILQGRAHVISLEHQDVFGVITVNIFYSYLPEYLPSVLKLGVVSKPPLCLEVQGLVSPGLDHIKPIPDLDQQICSLKTRGDEVDAGEDDDEDGRSDDDDVDDDFNDPLSRIRPELDRGEKV